MQEKKNIPSNSIYTAVYKKEKEKKNIYFKDWLDYEMAL